MLSRSGSMASRCVPLACHSLRFKAPSQPAVLVRLLSSQDIFGGGSSSSSSLLGSDASVAASSQLFTIPEPPLPPPFKKSIEAMYQDGESLLSELGLFQWWKPTGYLRYLLEYLHLHGGLEWWAAITCTTVALRLATVWVPIMSAKLQARMSQYAPELKDFQQRANDARQENNKMLLYQTMLDQRDFMHEKGIRQGRQLLALGANVLIFTTQFFTIKKIAKSGYPGFNEGGALWFKDLTIADPYYALPLISAVSMFAVMKVGIETGQRSDQLSPGLRIVLQYVVPVITLVASTQFSSAVCLYWATSNFMSLLYSAVLQTAFARRLFNIPKAAKHPELKEKQNVFSTFWKRYRAEKKAPPSLKWLKEKDALQFKNAGKGKPYKTS